MIDKNIYYKTDKGEIKYNEICEKCKYKCKQSFRSQIISCRHLKELSKNKKKVKHEQVF